MDLPQDDPPRIDWIGACDFGDGRPGRLGMTVLPGKRGPSVRYPGRVYRSNLDRDLESLTIAGARRLVLLVTDAELTRWSDSSIVERAAALAVHVDRFPMPDGSPPADDATMEAILDVISVGRDDGDVAVACMGGVGRTGTVVACALIRAGWDPDDAIAHVRGLRHPTAVETAAQERFVRARRKGQGVSSRGWPRALDAAPRAPRPGPTRSRKRPR